MVTAKAAKENHEKMQLPKVHKSRMKILQTLNI
jgi:hypothetical protein